MNKKILAISVLAVLMLVTITYASAISSNTTPVKKKESPLFKIRTKLAIGERLQNLRENIKAKFVGERIFFLPFEWLKNGNEFSERNLLAGKITHLADYTCATYNTCTYPETCAYPICLTWYQPQCNYRLRDR
jgi:hypothetical protein